MTTTEDTESLVNRIIAELEARPEVKPALLRALLTDEFLLLPAKADRLTEDVSELKADVSELKAGQARLERGQQRMSGELSNLSGSQYQRHVTEIGKRLVRRNMGIQNVRLLHADLIFGERMADDIAEEAENAGRITMDEGDALVMSDAIFIGEDEAGQPVQVLLEISLTVQQHDIERAEARSRILEKATGIRTLAGVVGESVPEEERTRAQGRGVAWMTVSSGRPPQ